MSLVDDILILVDSESNISLEDIVSRIDQYKKQIIASSLGRLTAKELIIKKTTSQGISYNITKSGRERINSVLDSIAKYSEVRSNQSWQIVVFDISEKERGRRDALRNSLINLGFGKLQDSIWLSYLNQYQEVEKIIEILQIQNVVTNLLIGKLSPQKDQELIKKINWNWLVINEQYRRFLQESKSFLANKHKDNFRAKQLVFNFAKILQKDPKLSESLQPKNALTSQAFSAYQKIRPFCYH